MPIRTVHIDMREAVIVNFGVVRRTEDVRQGEGGGPEDDGAGLPWHISIRQPGGSSLRSFRIVR
jgi:hypothetical protein